MGSFKSNAKPLVAALSKVLPAVERRNSIPILGNVRLAAARGALVVSGTNLDMQIDATASVDCGEPISLAVNPRPLLTVLRQLGDEVVTIEDVDGSALMTWSDGRAVFPTLCAADFPDLKVSGDTVAADLPPTFVSEGLDPVRGFISREETRYYLNGVVMDRNGEAAMLAATDGNRLGGRAAPALDAMMAALGALRPILPRHFVEVWCSSFRGQAVTLEVRRSDKGAASHAVLSAGNLRVSSKLIDGSYPDWQRVIPTGVMETLRVPRGVILMALHRLSAVTDSNPVRISAEAGVVTLNSRNSSLGSAEQRLASAEGGWLLPTTYKPAYLIDAIKQVRGDVISISRADPASPSLVAGSDDGADAHYVVMPMRESFGNFAVPDATAARKAA